MPKKPAAPAAPTIPLSIAVEVHPKGKLAFLSFAGGGAYTYVDMPPDAPKNLAEFCQFTPEGPFYPYATDGKMMEDGPWVEPLSALFPTPEGATAPLVAIEGNDTSTPIPEGHVRIRVFGQETFYDVPKGAFDDLPANATYALQYAAGNEFYFFDKKDQVISMEKAIFTDAAMSEVLARVVVPRGEASAPVVVETAPAEVPPPAPAPAAPPATLGVVAPRVGVYPDQHETRILKRTLTVQEREDASMKLAMLVREAEDIKMEKKSAAEGFKLREGECEKSQRDLSHLLTDGYKERKVGCSWRFECTGVTVDGTPVQHPDMKALLADDTKEVVEVRPMTAEDFNLRQLPLEAKPALPVAEAPDEVDNEEEELPLNEGDDTEGAQIE